MSGLTDYDRACLVAQYNSFYKKEIIDPKIFENRTEAEIKYLRRTMGVTVQQSCGLEFTKDFKDYDDYPHFNFVMTCAYAHIKSGALPYAGGVAGQPAQIMEIIELINQLDSEREQDARLKAQKEAKKRG